MSDQPPVIQQSEHLKRMSDLQLRELRALTKIQTLAFRYASDWKPELDPLLPIDREICRRKLERSK